jgi:hypothetical protein
MESISKKFSDAGVTNGTPDLNALNWFRIYHYKSGTVTTRIDGIQISKNKNNVSIGKNGIYRYKG